MHVFVDEMLFYLKAKYMYLLAHNSTKESQQKNLKAKYMYLLAHNSTKESKSKIHVSIGP